MVTVIKNFEDLKAARDEHKKPEDCIFDTTVILGKDGNASLQLDWKDIMTRADIDNNNFYYYVLENTKTSFKTQKAKAAFVNTLLRQIGQDMNIWYSGQDKFTLSIYNKDANDDKARNRETKNVCRFVKGLLDDTRDIHNFNKILSSGFDRYSHSGGFHKYWDKSLDSDAQVVANLLAIAGGGYLSEVWLNFGTMRFDADNPLHQKMANIATRLEDYYGNYDGGEHRYYSMFKGFTDRWMRDTEPTQHLKNKAAKAATKKELDAMAEMKNMPAERLLDEYKFRKSTLDESQKLTVIRWLIERAPIDQTWCLRLMEKLPSSYGFDKKAVGKATLVQDYYKLVEAFEKKYGDFIEQTKKHQQELQKKYDELKQRLESAKKAERDNLDIYYDLDRKLKKDKEYQSKLGNLRNRLFKEVVKTAKKDKETSFYNDIYKALDSMISKFCNDGTAKDLKELQIQGHPWALFGTKEQKARFSLMQSIVSEYNTLIKKENVPEKWTLQDYKVCSEAENKKYKLEEDVKYADRDFKKVDGELRDLNYYMDRFDSLYRCVAELKQLRADVFEGAKQKLAAKRAENPRVESGYGEFDRGAVKREEDAALKEEKRRERKQKRLGLRVERLQRAKLKKVTTMLERSNKNGKLTDAQIVVLAQKLVAEKE